MITLLNSVRVIHGPNEDTFEGIAGSSVGAVRSSLVDAFNIPERAWAFANGRHVGCDHRLAAGDVVEFVYPWGRKGAIPANEYGDVDIVNGVPDGLVHVDEPRLGPTCKSLGIDFARAIVDWSEYRDRGQRKRRPVFSGVVVEKPDHPKLMAALIRKARKRQGEAERVSVPLALFTLNRRAKRCRDLAQTYYQQRMHGLAGEMKREKEAIYDLKGQVLHHLVEAGVLTGGTFHRFPGGTWAEVLRGDGYTFHRPCPPQSDNPAVEDIDGIEARPKESKEPTLKVARLVIENFLEGKARVPVYQWPPQTRPRRHQHWDFDDELDDDIDYDDELDDDF